jgi:hypothetical protein
MEILGEASLDVGGEYRVCSGRVSSWMFEVERKSLGIVFRNKKMQMPETRKRTMEDWVGRTVQVAWLANGTRVCRGSRSRELP